MPGTTSSAPVWTEKAGYADVPDADLGSVVEWRLGEGGWERAEGKLTGVEVHIDCLNGETGLWEHCRSAQWTRIRARRIVESAIRGGRTGRAVRYVLVGCEPRTTMTEENKAKLKEASRRRREQERLERLSVTGTESAENPDEEEEDMNGEGEATAGTKARKPRAKKAKKAKKDKHEYLTVRYEAVPARLETEKVKKLLDAENESQAAMVMRFVAKKAGVLFSEVLDHMKSELKGTKVDTVTRNLRWYVNDLRKKGFIKSVEERVEAGSKEEAIGTD